MIRRLPPGAPQAEPILMGYACHGKAGNGEISANLEVSKIDPTGGQTLRPHDPHPQRLRGVRVTKQQVPDSAPWKCQWALRL